MQSYIQPELTLQKGEAAFNVLKKEVKSIDLEGSISQTAHFRTLMCTVILVPLVVFSWTSTFSFWVALNYFLIAILIAQFAFLGHEGGHGAISNSPTQNKFIGQYCMTIFAGLAFDEWRERHNVHHKNCQYELKDPDMDVAVVVSLTEVSLKQKRGIGVVFSRIQHFSIWWLSLFFGLSQRHLSQFAAIKQFKRYTMDCIFLILHFSVWIVFPVAVLGFPLSNVLNTYFIPVVIVGPYLAGVFWVNHIGMPLIDNEESFSFLEHQVRTSRNIKNPIFLDWLFGGLNYQIEHHLFPRIPANKIKRIQPIVKEQISRLGWNYNEYGWWETIYYIGRHLRQIGAQLKPKLTPSLSMREF